MDLATRVTKEQALAIASQVVAQQNQETSLPAAYYWVVAEPVEYDEVWYFDHTFDHREGRLAEEPLLLGVPPGLSSPKARALLRRSLGAP
jgi:hypothetical protein